MSEKVTLSTVLVVVIALTFTLFHLYTATFGLFTAVIQRGVHISLAIIMVFLLKPLSKNWDNLYMKSINWLLILLVIVTQSVLLLRATPEQMVERAVTGPTMLDLVAGGIMVLLVFEASRRVNIALALVSLVFMLYGFFGSYLPSLITHRGYNLASVIDYMIFSTEGLYGLPLGVSATIIALFIIFGSFLEISGGGNFFVNIAYAMTGKYKSGPALSAVASSSLMGSISGSAVANVSTTGTFTIPLMKKVGYKPSFAGGVEAASSSGGQLMPPIMGAGAFIMAEVLGIPFLHVAAAAIIPAVLYYLGVGWMIHLQSEKIGLKRIPEDERPSFKETLFKGFHFFGPLIVLIVMLAGFATSPTMAALWAILTVLVVSFRNRESWMTPKKIYQASVNGAKSAVDVAVACAAAGLIIGIFTLTGLGLKLSNLVITISQGHLFIALILTMVVCIILGMGVPTAAAYIITASLVAPALMEMGVEPIAAHLFIFYFAIISAITPPVALAAYAGAGIAGANSMRTAFTASKLGIVAYIVPFIFVYSPSIVLVGSAHQIILNTLTSLIGVFVLGIGVQGWFSFKINWLWRIVFLGIALTMIIPGLISDVIGLTGLLLLAILFFKIKSQVKAVEPTKMKETI